MAHAKRSIWSHLCIVDASSVRARQPQDDVNFSRLGIPRKRQGLKMKWGEFSELLSVVNIRRAGTRHYKSPPTRSTYIT